MNTDGIQFSCVWCVSWFAMHHPRFTMRKGYHEIHEPHEKQLPRAHLRTSIFYLPSPISHAGLVFISVD
jgi:hypothetical protein